MRWLVRFLAAIFVLAAGLGNAQPAPRRVALVIGNGAYQVDAWRLDNPSRDAALMAGKLRALGFEVEAVTDAGRTRMDAAFSDFGDRLKAAGPDAVGLFYYAGHGAQKDGVNFLVPVDANAATADRLRYQSPSMQFLLDDMAEAGNAVNIIILDACRDMPLPDGSRALAGDGLADVGRLPNVFIAYATAPGRTARDGGGSNSPFTATLAAALDAQAGDPIELLFSDVNARVYTSTGGGQAPEYRNGLVRAPRWSLATAPAARRPAPATASPADVRLAAINALLAPVSLVGSAPPATLSQAFDREAGDSVFFSFEEALLRPDAQAVLDKQARWLLAHAEVRVRIYGNADEREGPDAVMLGARRAKAVRDYLLGCGVPAERVGSTTFGLDQPLARPSDEASWAMNRRVQTRLISTIGAPAPTAAPPASGGSAATNATPAPATPYDLAALNPVVRRAVVRARTYEQRAVAMATHARDVETRAQDAVRRARAGEAGHRDYTFVEDGETRRYQGGFSNGKRNGYGVILTTDGGSYATRWRNDVNFDAAVFVKDGSRLEVELKDDSVTGVGVLVWSNSGDSNRRYAGGLERGHSAISGVLDRTDGTRLEGDFGDGQNGFTGHGVEWDAQGRPLRQGVWNGGQLVTPLPR